jgi:hypothetical protein
MKAKEIEWSDEKDIVDLITELAELLAKDYKTIRLEGYTSEQGSTESGAAEFEFPAGKLVAE